MKFSLIYLIFFLLFFFFWRKKHTKEIRRFPAEHCTPSLPGVTQLHAVNIRARFLFRRNLHGLLRIPVLLRKRRIEWSAAARLDNNTCHNFVKRRLEHRVFRSVRGCERVWEGVEEGDSRDNKSSLRGIQCAEHRALRGMDAPEVPHDDASPPRTRTRSRRQLANSWKFSRTGRLSSFPGISTSTHPLSVKMSPGRPTSRRPCVFRPPTRTWRRDFAPIDLAVAIGWSKLGVSRIPSLVRFVSCLFRKTRDVFIRRRSRWNASRWKRSEINNIVATDDGKRATGTKGTFYWHVDRTATLEFFRRDSIRCTRFASVERRMKIFRYGAAAVDVYVRGFVKRVNKSEIWNVTTCGKRVNFQLERDESYVFRSYPCYQSRLRFFSTAAERETTNLLLIRGKARVRTRINATSNTRRRRLHDLLEKAFCVAFALIPRGSWNKIYRGHGIFALAWTVTSTAHDHFEDNLATLSSLFHHLRPKIVVVLCATTQEGIFSKRNSLVLDREIFPGFHAGEVQLIERLVDRFEYSKIIFYSSTCVWPYRFMIPWGVQVNRLQLFLSLLEDDKVQTDKIYVSRSIDAWEYVEIKSFPDWLL